MRKIELIGNVCKTPEARTAANGKAVTVFDVAVYVSPEKSDFYRINAWNKLGESCAKYLDKGRKVFVRGDLTVNLYTTKQGETRFSLDVTATEIEFLSPKEEKPKTEQPKKQNPVDDPAALFSDLRSDDLPF